MCSLSAGWELEIEGLPPPQDRPCPRKQSRLIPWETRVGSWVCSLSLLGGSWKSRAPRDRPCPRKLSRLTPWETQLLASSFPISHCGLLPSCQLPARKHSAPRHKSLTSTTS